MSGSWVEGRICSRGMQLHGGGHPLMPTSAPTASIKRHILPIGSTKNVTLSTNSLLTRGRRRLRPTMSLNAVPASAAETLRKGIAEFYDESSGVWEDIWGDHMHHGFYDPASDVSISDHRAAQIRMIEESLRFASLSGTSLDNVIMSYLLYND